VVGRCSRHRRTRIEREKVGTPEEEKPVFRPEVKGDPKKMRDDLKHHKRRGTKREKGRRNSKKKKANRTTVD